MAPLVRTWSAALLDIWAGWSCGLPAETCAYTLESLRIPIEGGAVELAANLWRPLLLGPGEKKPRGTVLVRTPYGISPVVCVLTARVFASRGYVVLVSACRGTAGSEGKFRPGHYDAADGKAVVEWMRGQEWYTGSFAMLGGSYLAYSQMAVLAAGEPADMRTAILSAGLHDFGGWMWGRGALNSSAIFWAGMVSSERKSILPLPLRFWAAKGHFARSMRMTPLLDGVREFIGGDNLPGYLTEWLNCSDLDDPKWTYANQFGGIERAGIPIALFTGWNDFAITQVMQVYYKLCERGVRVNLTIGPWTHLEAQRGSTKLDSFHWLEEHLAGKKPEKERAPIRIYVTGLNEWREYSEWPPAPRPQELFFGPDRDLLMDKPTVEAADVAFTFDPNDPTPCIGAPTLDNMGGGSEYDTLLADRPDVASFTTAPLAEDMEIGGKPSVVLHHSSDSPYFDVLVRLSEVDARGRSRRIGEHYSRMERGDGHKPLELVLQDCAHRFRRGTRVRVLVAGGSHPRYVRNTGMEDNSVAAVELRAVRHCIGVGALSLSRVVLPVVV